MIKKRSVLRPPAQHARTAIHLSNRIANFSVSVNYLQSRNLNPPKRSPIRYFSGASYRRLRNLVLSLDKPPTLFITLTYPSEFPTARASKKHLDNFAKAFMRRYPYASAIWKQEPQKRGAPHFHLLVTGIHLRSAEEYYDFANFVSLAWFRIVGSNDFKHLRAGTQVINLEYKSTKKTIDALSIYLTKYFSKSFSSLDPSIWSYPGRFWGVFGRANLSVTTHYFTIDLDSFYKIRRVFRKKLKKYLLSRYGKLSKPKLLSGNFSLTFSSYADFYSLLSRLASLFGADLVYRYSVSTSHSSSFLFPLFIQYDDIPF